MRNIIRLIILALIGASCLTGCNNKSIEIRYEYLGKAIQKEGTHVWGTSPVVDKHGKYHYYVAEWPMPTDPQEAFSGWYKSSRIAHYVSDRPEGPYTFLRIAVPDRDGEFNSPHNPTIHYMDGKYVLCFIVNENDDLKTQRIIMYVADDLNDNWRPAAGAKADGTILTAPDSPKIWNYNPRLGVSNPSLVKFHNKYMLYYKSVIPDPANRDDRQKWNYGYGVALSDKLEGPYTCYPKRVTEEGLQLEDAYAFPYNNKMYMLSRDFRGSLGSAGGGLLWESKDGFSFSRQHVTRAFNDLANYVGPANTETAHIYRGSRFGDLERPQLLFENGVPAYMYVATGMNAEDGYGSCSHVFKLQISEK